MRWGASPARTKLRGDVADVEVPATLQATIGARIDRLEPGAKRTLNAATVIGSRFDSGLLTSLVGDTDVSPLIEAELIEQVKFTPTAEYAFRHPLIRKVAYESQLRSDRAQLHRLLAAAIEARGDPDANAALVAETPRGSGRFARGLQLAHARGLLVEHPRQHCRGNELATGPRGRR